MRIKPYTFVAIAFGLLLQGNIHAQNFDLDIINLQNRSAEEVVPLLEPFLIPEASITARDYKLIIKSTPENLVEIRELITELDTQLRQLVITVSVGRHEEQQTNDIQAGLKAEINDAETTLQAGTGDIAPIEDTTTMGSIVRVEKETDKAKMSAQLKSRKTTTRRDKPAYQTIRSSEGQWATIRTGQAIPVVVRTQNPDGTVTQTTKYRGATSGFSVLPRLRPNNRVVLYIRPSRTTPSHSGGRFDIQSMQSTVEGKLGEWITLGSMSQLSSSQGSSVSRATRSHSEQQDNVFVKIETVQ